MKKFYTLLAPLIFTLLCLQINARNIDDDSCRADFEKLTTATNNSLRVYYSALAWHNNNKKPEQICWSFGDNHDTCFKYDPALSNNYFAAHTYEHADTYNVCVKIIYQGGCLSYKCKLIQVGDTGSCQANFETLASTSNLLGKYFTAQPLHSQNKKPVRICWNFGDDHDTCIQYSPTSIRAYGTFHSYEHSGNYNVCVKILYDGGCEAQYCQSVLVGASNADSCRADFEKLTIATNNPLRVYYSALAWHNNNKKPEQICWSFGDNHDTCFKYDPALSNNYFAAHTYEHADTYNVCVKIIYQGGCLSYKCKLIQVGDTGSCQANFETLASTSNLLGKYFVAQPLHSQNKKPVRICWNFGDDHDTCIQYSPTSTRAYGAFHSYEHSGNYNVCVKILYDGGCESHYCRSVLVGSSNDDSCRSNFETITSIANPLRKYFLAQPWHNHNKKPLLVCWNFGDNHDTCIQYSTTYTGSYAVSHLYSHTGNYNVCVKIHYDGGCESSNCKSLESDERDSCRADFEKLPVSSANNALHVYYRALPWNNHERKPARICWSFGDGRDTCISYSENYPGSFIAAHHYVQPGVYEVCVVINYYGGCESKKCKIVNISLHNTDTCRVHLFEITPSVISLTRGFYFTSLNNNRPSHTCWNFGDGADTCIAIESNTTEIPHVIKHTYPAPGVYRACVKVLFLNGCSASDCHEVSIRIFTDLCGGYYTDSLINPHTYVFKGFSIHKPDDAVISYRWTFGDGSSGAGERVTHTYDAAGVYRVCLLINTEKGCETRICNDVKIAGTTQTILQLSPNPVANVLHASFYSAHNETVTIRIINSNGVVVRTYTRTAVAGFNTWDFDVTDLLAGGYSFAVESSNQFANGIFIKQ